jgi:8-oxo-dGTP pyrophosphatase MutT (NUDIX family)
MSPEPGTAGPLGERPDPLGERPDPFGEEWQLGSDGLLHRRGARVLLVAGAPGDERLLLVHGHDVDQPGRTWWFTVGGGIGAGEEPLTAALREVAEETGLVLAPGQVVGPVFTRSAVFDFFARTCRQDEVVYLARLPQHPDDLGLIDDAGWTDVERASIDEVRWWSLPELAALEAGGTEVYPEGLAALVAGLLEEGWDGTVRHLGRGLG